MAEPIKICCVVSIPRLGWNDHWGCLHDALRPLGIPIRRFTGAFWGQCLQSVLEDCMDDGLDWVIVADYDTMFTKWQLDHMLGVFGERADIDALAPIQVRRNRTTPLMSIRGQSGVEIDGSPLQVSSANFGLTLLRMESLAEVQKPWFMHWPTDSGTWRDGEKNGTPHDMVNPRIPELRPFGVEKEYKLDDDIWFWRAWKKTGKTIFVDTSVVVGHLECMVSVYDDDMEIQHISVKDWHEKYNSDTVRVGTCS